MSDFGGTVTDVLGNPINVGDEIAGAFRIGNTAVMRVGTVQGFGERGNKLTVKVKWTTSSREYDHEVTGAIEADLQRFVRLGTQAPSAFDPTPAATPVSEIPATNP